jgi:hypothetical protein
MYLSGAPICAGGLKKRDLKIILKIPHQNVSPY